MPSTLPLFFSAIFLFSLASANLTPVTRNYGENTTILACEGVEAHLECPAGTVIRVRLANFGRFSKLACVSDAEKERGDLPQQNCLNPRTKTVLQEKCDGLRECVEPAEVANFLPDPCPTVSKYLDVTYSCVAQATSSTSTTTTTTTTTTTPKPLSSHEEKNEVNAVQTTDNSTPSPVVHCSPRISNGIEYSRTEAGRKSTLQSCMDGATGESWWECGSDGFWIGKYPNTTRCASDWTYTKTGRLAELKAKKDGPGLPEFLRGLAQDTRRPMQAGDVPRLLHLLSQVTEMLMTSEWTTSVRSLCNDKLVEIVNYVSRSPEAWPSWSIERRREMSSQLLYIMEKVLSWSTLGELSTSSLIYAQPSVTVQISDAATSFDSAGIDYITLPSSPIWDDLHNQDSVDVPIEALKTTGYDDARIFFSTVSSLSSNMQPRPILRKGADGQFFDGDMVERRVVSNIVTASVVAGGRTRKIRLLDQPVFITFLHRPDQIRHMSHPECSWWSEDRLKWSSTGCDLRSHNESHSVCACSHLTHFALLMDVRGHELSSWNNQMLTFLTYFGCTLSIVCLLITFTCFVVFSKAGGDRVFIHKNLCLMLAFAELLFLFGIWRTGNKLECSVIAGALLYLFLSAFTWMLLEGYQLYQMLVQVFPTGSRKCLFTLLGYGFPALVTAAAVYFQPEGFGTSDHCWLRADNLSILFFVGPAALILIINTVFLVMTMCIVYRHSNGGYLPCRHEPDVGKNIRSWLKGSLSISCLLGVTWSLGFLWIDDDHSIYMAYAFTIANSLQGLTIFLFHIVFNDKMRKDISRWFSRGGDARDIAKQKASLARGTMSPSNESGTGSEFLYPPSEKYHSTPRATMEAHQAALMYQYQQHMAQQGTYDYASIAYGEMIPGQVNRALPNYRIQNEGRSPDYRPYSGSVHRDQLYGSVPLTHGGYHRPPPEFSPPPPPADRDGNVPRALYYAAARRPPSSKISDDSAYSEGGSSMLATEVTPSGATVLRMDLSKNPPVFCHEL